LLGNTVTKVTIYTAGGGLIHQRFINYAKKKSD
jgi:hypothetical protein